MDTSDYARTLAPVIRTLVPEVGALLDVGAGGGQLGQAIRDPRAPWTAIEPSPTMRRRLERLIPSPEILASGWHDAAVAEGAHDTVLAATMPAFFDDAPGFLARCRAWARRTVLWVVPAQAGPRGLCFAGCLPRDWHREDETPGVDLVLRALPREHHPERMAVAEWTFTGEIADLPGLSAYLADRLGWAARDPRRGELLAHLAGQAAPLPHGHRLAIPRKSAVRIWGSK
jgi:hypothetical protein